MTNEGEQIEPLKEASIAEDISDDGAASLTRMPKPKRECPVPKPGGLVGEILGFQPSSSDGDGKGRPP